MADNPTPAAGIEIRSLYKVFGSNAAQAVELVKGGMSKAELNEKHGNVLGLKDINLEMPGGCIQVIMGLSGSGKSTLIRHINRLIDPTVGEVLVGGHDVVKMNEHDLREFRRKNTAMVFQKFALLPHRTVLDNTVYGLQIQGVPRKKQVEEAMRWINRVGLSGFENRYPNQLSGGMQQRVGLARALTNDAPILLMDEPAFAPCVAPSVPSPGRSGCRARTFQPPDLPHLQTVTMVEGVAKRQRQGREATVDQPNGDQLAGR